MNTRITGFLTTVALLLAQFAHGQVESNTRKPESNDIAHAKATLKESAGKLWFQVNKGQLPNAVQYFATTQFGAVYVEQNTITLVARKKHEAIDESDSSQTYSELQRVRISFQGGTDKFKVQPANRLLSNINYFTSPDPSKFVYGVQAYSELYLTDVYPGIDLRLYSMQNGQMEFDWILKAGGDYSKIKMELEGHEDILIHENGGFSIQCKFEALNFDVPESYQLKGDIKLPVTMKYVRDGNILTFKTTSVINPELPLVIDPTVYWANYMDASGNDYLFASESDDCGRVYLAGRSDAAATTTYIQGATGYDVSFNSGYNTIMYIFSADGDSLKAFTYFGTDITPADLDLFPNGRVIVGGSMRDKNGGNTGSIPLTTNGTVGGQPTYAAYSSSSTLLGKGWLAIFDSELRHLYYSSHMPGTSGVFGGFDEKGVTCIEAVDNSTYYVAGITDVDVRSGTGTTFVNNTSTPDNTQNRGEAYIARFSGTSYNTWNWGTYVGGNDDEIFVSIKASSDGTKLAFAGNFIDDNVASGAGFPTRVNPVDNTSAASEGFVGWLTNQSTNPGNFGMLSFLGGAGEEGDLLVESMKQYIYVLGYTNSASFPGTSVSGFTPYQAAIKGTAGTYDAFVSKIPFNGSSAPAGVFRSTYFGGGGTELSGGVIFNTNDSNLYLFITTGSASVGQVGATTGYPTVNTNPPSNFYDPNHDNSAHTNWTPQTGSGVGSDADISFVTLSPDLTKNIYTSYCGGSDRDYLGNTGRLNGAGHYGFNYKTNIYSLGTTIHSNDLAARGSYIFNNQSFFDTTSTGGDDHLIVKFNLSNTDMGDAPRSYDGGNPARHGTSSLGLNVAKFGAALTDYDSRPESSNQADGDDNRNTGPALCKALLDDEDGLISPPPTITVETTGNVNVPVYINNGIGGTANVYAWIDFDGDGQFESGEIANSQTAASNLSLTGVSFTNSGTTITATKAAHGLTVGSYIGIEGSEGNQEVINGIWQVTAVPSTSTFQFVVTTTPPGALGSVTNTVQKLSRTNLVFNLGTGKSCPNEIRGGRTYLRMRITTSTLTDTVATANLDERSHGVAPNGEIEDHVIYIRGRDYGDLPASYGTPSVMVFGDIDANNIPEDAGAVWLGSTVDIEKDCAANLSANADGDDLENDDENGLTIPSTRFKASSNYNFTLNFSRSTSGTNVHYGLWFDWNADGDFTDATDGFYSGSSTAASATISVTTPGGTAFNPNFAIRAMVGTSAFSSANYNLVYTNGEIEDYINDPGLIITGQVFNDGDGTYDASIDNNPGFNTNSPSGTQLWAYLLNPAGTAVIDSVAVLSNGTYLLQGASASTSGYEVRISTSRAAIGAAPAAVTLPTNWVSVGEQYGTSNGAGTGIEALTPASNSRVAVNTGTTDITNLNFGIDFRPQSFDTTAATQSNPGGSIQYPVIGLRGHDREQGMFFGSQQKTIIIESLPSNATLYYDSDGAGGNPPVAVTLGQVINNYVASNLLVDPSFTGVGNVVFTYAWRDSAQAKDLTPATVTLPFGDPSITISGTVFDDGDGNLDGAIDGTAIGTADGNQLYVYLDSSGIIVRKVTLSGTGTYSFTGNPSQAYTVIATSANLSIGATAPTSSVLPTNWLNTGEQFGTNNTSGSGIESGTANGVISVNSNLNVTNVNFGIEKRPESNNVTATAQTNPGGTVQVQVPALTGSDLEDGTLPNNTTPSRTVVVESLPSNATLYYNGVAVTVGQVIANYNSTLLTVDPNFNGAGTVTFTYAWRDSAQAKDLSPATVTMPFEGLTLSGQVFDDGDGNFDAAIDGTGIGSPASTQLYAYLDSAGVVVQKVTLPANGVYTFANVSSTTSYNVVVTSNNVALGAATPAATLPTNWINTGEQFGSNNTAGSGIESGTANGIIAITTAAANLNNVNFGINERPQSNNVTATAQTNPGGTVQVQVPALSGSDLEDGTLPNNTTPSRTVVVETLPSNATLYYNGVAVTVGQVIANYNSGLLTVDPNFNGAGTVSFTYAWRDSAQAKDLTPATVTMPFEGLTLSGQVFDDGDGNFDAAIDGTGIGSPASTQLYAYLDSAGLVVRKVTLPSNGVYSFSNVSSTTSYNVVVTSNNVALGAATPAATLPTNWINTGEQFGSNNTAGSGIESGTANGRIAITTAAANLTNVNFGINERPESNNVTASTQSNPGGTVQVQVPALSGSDLEDGTLPNNTTPSRTFVVESLPSNATLYYNGVAVTVGQVIANYNSSLLTVDPNFNGAGTVSFTYAWRDSAQAKDLSPATVTMPFDALTISGTVYHDPDGLTDSDVDGQGQGSFTGTQLIAYLVDGSNTIIGANTVASNGTYSFSNANANSTFTVLVTTQSLTVGSAAPSSSVLPTNFVHVGEEYGVNNNAGSGVVAGTPNGIITVSTTTSNVSNVDFGIEYGTHAHDKIYQITPDSIYLRTGAPSGFTHYIHLNRAAGTADTNVNSTNTTVMPGLLSGFDLEEGRYEGSTGRDSGTIVFTTLPDTNNALLMYNGIRLRPNPSVSDPSWIYWNSSTGRYEIPNFQANAMIMLFKMAYQSNTSFNYAFIDSAGITGRIGTYTLNYTVPLPIDLSDLSCASGNGGITLQWSAYNVSELQSMHVLRSTDGVAFARIASFTQFNRNQNFQSFRYVDVQTEAAQQIYKIEAIDLNGAVSYTNLCWSRTQGAVEAVKITGIPNPTEGLINVNIQTPIDQNFGIRIQDASGRLLLEKSVDASHNMDLPFDLSNYAPGIYNIVVNWEGRSEVIRIVRL